MCKTAERRGRWPDEKGRDKMTEERAGDTGTGGRGG